MKRLTTRQLVDKQLLSIIESWSEVYHRMESSAFDIPAEAFDWEDEDDYVCPELAATRMYDNLQGALLHMARTMVSAAQEVCMISLDEWRTINHILWLAGTDEPIEEDWA